MNRRDFLTQSLGFFLISGASVNSQIISNQEFENDTDYIYRDDIYAKNTKLGPYQAAKNPYFVDLSPYSLGKCYIWVSQTVESAKPIIFNHNIFGTPETYDLLFRFLTTHGFAIIAPLFDDKTFVTDYALENMDNFRGLDYLNEEQTYNVVRLSNLAKYRYSLCEDLYEFIPTLANALSIAIKQEGVVSMGHGFGAYVSQLQVGIENSVVQPSNVPWRAGILFDPYGPELFGISEESFNNIKIPYICYVGEQTLNYGKQPVDSRASIFFSQRGKRNYMHAAYFQNGDDSVYTGVKAVRGTDQKKFYDDIRVSVILFLKGYVDYDSDAFYGLYNENLMSKFGSGNLKLLSE